MNDKNVNKQLIKGKQTAFLPLLPGPHLAPLQVKLMRFGRRPQFS